MKTCLCVLLMVVLVAATAAKCDAMTCVPDPAGQGLRCFGRLTLAESPYFQTMAMNVRDGDTLTIEPGVILYLTGGWLVIRPGGTLIAEEASIVQIITGPCGADCPCGIDIEHDATVFFDHCQINVPTPCGYGNAAILIGTSWPVGPGGTLHIYNSTIISGGEFIYFNGGILDSSNVTLQPVPPLQPPMSNGTVTLSGGSINGVPVENGTLELTVAPGGALSGTISAQVDNWLPPSAVAPLITVWGWGIHESSFSLVHPSVPVGISSHQVSVDLTAPTMPGTYFVTIAMQGEMNGAQIASLTNWTVGGNHWNDGVDIADWGTDKYALSLAQHAVLSQYTFPPAWYPPHGFSPWWVPAAMIRITVQAGMLIHVGEHFCLDIVPGRDNMVYWCCPYDGPPHFTWLPGCMREFPLCSRGCTPNVGWITWTIQYDSSSIECPAPGGWWSARFTTDREGCICVFFEFQESVELIDFAATASDQSVTLTWATASETDNDRFEIHRSSEAGAWARIGTVSGHGTASTTHHYSFLDENVQTGTTYSYRLASVDLNGAREWVGDIVWVTPIASDIVPATYALHQNHPNPFNPTTDIVFEIAEAGQVALKVFNVAGQEVATLLNGPQTAGLHCVTFDGSVLPSGVYFYGLSAGDFTATRKMLLLK